jgi:hypothetical protein
VRSNLDIPAMSARYLWVIGFCLGWACAVEACAVEGGAIPKDDCRGLCDAWNRSQTAACESDDPDDERCARESLERADACATIVDGECAPDVQRLFETPPPPVCTLDSAVRSTCEGASMIGQCDNGRKVRAACDAAACPGAGSVTLGCRLDPNGERAFCECGCDPDTTREVCADSERVTYCAYSELRTERCSDEACAASGYGRSRGCGAHGDGEGCLCEEPCALADNYCSGTVLNACVEGVFEPVQCSDASCFAAGFGPFVRCGLGVDGQAACLCE